MNISHAFIHNISNSENKSLYAKDYLKAIEPIYGKEKISQVCERYNLFQSPKSTHIPINNHHIHQLHVGLYDINIHDLNSFLNKIKCNTPLNQREKDALENMDPKIAEDLISFTSASSLPAHLFNSLISSLRKPNNSYSFNSSFDPDFITAIPGKLFSKEYWLYGWFSHSLGRNHEDESRLTLYQELENLNANDLTRYCEIITKIMVKKHLYYEKNGSHTLGLGMLLPAPKGANGEARWYRVEDIVDSGLAKFTYRLVPATSEYSHDMPDLILYRSSSSLPTALDSFTCFLSDISVLPPGYLSKWSCVNQENKWISTSSATAGGNTRALIITGHSLGGSNAQLALLNLQQSQQWPDRHITVKIFDSPVILDRDVRKFAEWIKVNDIKTQLDFQYYISDGDPVPLAGSVEKSSYLGNYIDQSNCTSSIQKLKLTKTGLTKPALIGLHVHDRIFHRGIEGVDFTSTKMSILQYDAKVLKERIRVNTSRIFTGAVIWATLAPIGAAKRFFLGRRHHDAIIVQLFKSLNSGRIL